MRAWRLRRQLVEPRGSAGAAEVSGRLCGVQAQVASAAALAVALRQSRPRPGAAERALAEGALMKTWAMRGTLHLRRPADARNLLPLVAAARSWEKPSWQRAFGATPAEVDALAEAVGDALRDGPLTRDELVGRLIADPALAGMEAELRSGWAALLKPLAWRGILCHGPSRGGAVTFARPDALMPEWTGLADPDEAAPEAIAAYLGAYGPATPRAFDEWLLRGVVPKATLRGWFAAAADRLTTVHVDGEEALILAELADGLARTRPSWPMTPWPSRSSRARPGRRSTTSRPRWPTSPGRAGAVPWSCGWRSRPLAIRAAGFRLRSGWWARARGRADPPPDLLVPWG